MRLFLGRPSWRFGRSFWGLLLISTSLCSSDRAQEDVADPEELFQLGERYRIGED